MAEKKPGRTVKPVPLWLVWALIVVATAIFLMGLWQLFGPLAWRNVVQGWISAFLGVVCISGGVNELFQRRGDPKD